MGESLDEKCGGRKLDLQNISEFCRKVANHIAELHRISRLAVADGWQSKGEVLSM